MSGKKSSDGWVANHSLLQLVAFYEIHDRRGAVDYASQYVPFEWLYET